MASCSRPRCRREGTHHPVLILAPTEGDRPPAQFILGVLICPPHQDTTEVGDLIASDGWEHVDQAFTIAYGVPPDHDTVGLVWHREHGAIVPTTYPTVSE